MKCRSCRSAKLEFLLDLGEQPWCNDFLTKERVGKENVYPLRLNYCKECELLQLDHTVPKETMFGDHCYLSGITKTLVDHFYEVAKENVEQFNMLASDLVVDIGGNDGTQMLQYKKAGIDNVVNVECAKRVSEISKKNNILTINEYFNRECVEKYIGKGVVRLYNASGVFFHLEELHSVIDGIKYSLKEDGVLIVQFMYAGTMIEKLNFDTIYHEHLCYYTLRSLNNLLAPYDLKIFDAYYSEIHSGSIVAKITHTAGVLDVETERYAELLEKDKKYSLEAFREFAKTIEAQKGFLKEALKRFKDEGKTIYAYGAPAKGNTLLNYFEIDNTLVDKAVEINEMKVGNFLPQSHIPITLEDKNDLPDYYLLLSHNFAEEIIEKNHDIMAKGVKFIIPFPEVKIVGAQVRLGAKVATRSQMKPLHLCVVMSDSYFPIYQKIFNRTLPKEFDSVNILHIRDHDSTPGHVAEQNFKVINYKKLDFVAKQMIMHEEDNLLVLDIDIVCFRNFKQEINHLLESNDMVFQENPYNKRMPYGIGVWGLQCSKKNIAFFGQEVLTRAQALLYTKEELDYLYDNKIPVPLCWQHRLNKQPTPFGGVVAEHYAGDQCVINAAILESDLGKELNVSLLPNTYAQNGSDIDPNRDDFSNAKNHVLYHATSGGQSELEKAQTLVNVYEKVMEEKDE